MKKYFRKFGIIVLLLMTVFSTTGCISFWKGIFESVLPSIDMKRLTGNTDGVMASFIIMSEFMYMILVQSRGKFNEVMDL